MSISATSNDPEAALHGTPVDAAAFLPTAPRAPGVYRMLDAAGQVLYVGKAGNLQNRLRSYFGKPTSLSLKTRHLMQRTCAIELTVTVTEAEALILENNLIKHLRPRYNILFRDDKSYPYIRMDTDHPWPRLSLYRGRRRRKGRYFGPYANVGAVRSTLNLVQKMFRIRNCTDSVFAHRSRPCLQYQIQRCTAPCVGLTGAEDYHRDLQRAVLLLEGRNEELVRALEEPMQQAAQRLEFEQAGRYRDLIAQLRAVQEQHRVSTAGMDLDVIAARQQGDLACVQLFTVRDGINQGNQVYFPEQAADTGEAEVLASFLAQHYLDEHLSRPLPPRILLSHKPTQAALLEQVLSERAGRRVWLRTQARGALAHWLRLALENAGNALAQRLTGREQSRRQVELLQPTLGLPAAVSRVECFDISHTRGEAPVAACVVFGLEGPLRSDYRRFTIRGVDAGDDYAALQQAVRRRYRRLREEGRALPELLLIDGGRGQVRRVREALGELELADLAVVGIAKGPRRRPGEEVLFPPGRPQGLRLDPALPVFHLLQRIRDEAHRYALAGHRRRRGEARRQSPLEAIPGVGAQRRRELIRHFGGLQGVVRASPHELARVPGIGPALAEKIHAHVQGGQG